MYILAPLLEKQDVLIMILFVYLYLFKTFCLFALFCIQKIDEENLGIGGHSQGGVGAVKTILFRKGGGRFKTVVTVSAVTESFADKLKMNSWKYDASAEYQYADSG